MYRLLLLCLALMIASCKTQSDQVVKDIQVKNGVVTSAHALASQIGVDIMKKGGNAVDAAIAVQFALAVVYPIAGNIGGGGFMIYRQPNGESFALGDAALMLNESEYGHPQVAQVAIQQADNLANNLIKDKRKAFAYNDLGSMATIGRNKAVCDFPRFSMKGFFAWLIWLLVHLMAILGVKNKVFVIINWFWNYVTYDQSLRLIIKPKQPMGTREGE